MSAPRQRIGSAGSKRQLIWLIPAIAAAALVCAFLLYAEIYYHADETALAALATDDEVSVTRTGYGWRFDGPADGNALIFYPGAKVEETAYAPLLRRIAGQGMDVCLVKMPFRLAIFGVNRAEAAMAAHDYDRWYIGGHSLGGAMVASYAAKHPDRLSGVILFAAYPTEALDDRLGLLSVYGSEDGVLNRKRLSEGGRFAPEDARICVIEGGNHAGFGSYGEQRGDGAAIISPEEQQRRTAELIAEFIMRQDSVKATDR